jgi:hypothetical protein
MVAPGADCDSVVVPALIAAGLVFGAVVGRWWSLLGAVVIGLLVGLVSEVEVSSTLLGLVSGVVAAFAIAVGVALRRGLARALRA